MHHDLPQVEYLAGYLQDLQAASLLIESHYIDRHFIEEIGLYYSRCLVPKKNSCARIHVFGRLREASLHEAGSFEQMLRRATTGGFDRILSDLQESYLGFIVIRPLPSVPIGRTVLALSSDITDPESLVSVPYSVHLLGFELKVQGIAFQQQDRAVGACATTAVWTALQRSRKNEGDRPPTPSAVTEAAVRYSVGQGRAYPSSGLFIEQICEALRHFDFPPEVLDVAGAPDYFKLLLHVYLRSGIPVILGLAGQRAGHAVTAVGYRAAPPPPPGGLVELGDLRLRNLEYDHVHIHDDRLGPYVPAGLSVEPGGRKGLGSRLVLRIPWPEGPESLEISKAVVPLYPKLRSRADELFESAIEILPLVRETFTGPGDQLALEIFFQRSGEYLAGLYNSPASPVRVTNLLKHIALSRYVGVVRWLVDDDLLLDTLWDTTDRLRETRFQEHLLGLVAFSRKSYTKADQLGKHLGLVVG